MTKKKKVILIILSIIILLIVILGLLGLNLYNERKKKEQEEKSRKELIASKYNKYVSVINDSDILVKKEDRFTKIGTISQGYELTLGNILGEYYEIVSLDGEYYIKYDNVMKIDEIDTYSDRYKKYIPFNENIVTKDRTNLYDENDNLVLSLNKGLDAPIIIKNDKYYGIIYSDRLLYIKKDDGSIIEHNNTDVTNTNGIPVLNYHFVHRDSDNSCNGSICISETNFRKHLDYIKNNNYLTITARELEMYIDGNINLPSSVLITLDDGPYFYDAKRILNEYKLHATYFFVTSWLVDKLDEMESEYVELHSHTDNMHSGGVCPFGQGGGIKCLSESVIQEDLKKSREKLNGSTYIAYPFYEYNNYSIEQLKKAGFTMAFGGYYENGYKYVKPGINKFKLPRLVIYNNTGVSTIENYLKLK